MALKLEGLSRVPPKQKFLLAVLVCLLTGVGYYYLYYQAVSQRIASLQGQLAGLESRIKEQRAIAQNLPLFRAEVAALESRLGLLLEQLPDSAEIPALLKNVSDLGRNAGLEFVRFAPRREVGRGFYAEIPVVIAVAGRYLDFAVFADRVRHLPRIVNLSDIVFSQPRRARDGSMTTRVECIATTYRFLEQNAGAGGKGTAQ
jgi:type IV pilus assembly protein PilO